MIKGQKVRFIEPGVCGILYGNLTRGKVYRVTAGAGDALKSVQGGVGGGAGFEVRDDNGDYIYSRGLLGSLWGDWEIAP